MEEYPIITKKTLLLLEFAPTDSRYDSIPLHIVLDLEQFGEIIAVEIISIMDQAGKNCLHYIKQSVPTGGNAFRYAYDEECDCLSLVLQKERSVDQKSVDAIAFVDDDGRITSLRIEV